MNKDKLSINGAIDRKGERGREGDGQEQERGREGDGQEQNEREINSCTLCAKCLKTTFEVQYVHMSCKTLYLGSTAFRLCDSLRTQGHTDTVVNRNS